MFEAWDGFKERYPGAPLFIVIDSIGNIVSERDATMDLVEDGQKPGGKGQINRLAINKMVAKRDEDNAAILLINYTYDNIGSVGKTNAGGTALNLFSSLTYQTSRKKWVERTEKGERIRIGAEVQWSLYKNHINVDDPGPQKVVLKITADGIEYTSVADKPAKESEA
jgi:hypothetical protein